MRTSPGILRGFSLDSPEPGPGHIVGSTLAATWVLKDGAGGSGSIVVQEENGELPGECWVFAMLPLQLDKNGQFLR